MSEQRSPAHRAAHPFNDEKPGIGSLDIPPITSSGIDWRAIYFLPGLLTWRDLLSDYPGLLRTKLMLIPLRDDLHLQARPLVTYTLIGACIIPFLLQQSLEEVESQRLIYSFGIIPALLLEHARLAPGLMFVSPEAALFTSMFLHAGWIHLIGNMLYLWIFGDDVEDSMGRYRYLVFYLLCGLAGALSHVAAHPTSEIPVVGASGAVSGVLGAYLLLYPHARILVLLPMGPFSRLVRLPAFLVLGFWIVFQLLNAAFAAAQENGVAWYDHIGGFVTGLALVPLFKHRKVRLLQPAHGSRRWLRKL